MDHLLPEGTCKLCRTMINAEGYGPLIELGLKRGIAPETMISFLDTVADVSQFHLEGKHRSLALLVGDGKTFDEILKPSVFSLQKDYSVGKFRCEFQALGGLLDGSFLILTANTEGKITGIKRTFRKVLGSRYEEEARTINPIYSGSYRHIAVISKMTRSLAFYVPPEGNLAIVFDHGRIVVQYAMGDWQPADYDLLHKNVLSVAEEILTDHQSLAEDDADLFRLCVIKLLRVAFLMSSQRIGTILSLDLKLKEARRKTSRLTKTIGLLDRNVLITDLEDGELANIASLDGAVLVNGQGRLLEFNAILSPQKVVEGEMHYGARHNTTLNYSAEREMAIVLTVSQDGGVTVFFRGQQVAAVRVR